MASITLLRNTSVCFFAIHYSMVLFWDAFINAISFYHVYCRNTLYSSSSWMQPSTAIKCYTEMESLFSLQTLPEARLCIVRTLPVVSCSHLAWCSGWNMAGTAQGFSLVFLGIAWTVLPVLRAAWWYPSPGKRKHMLTATSFTVRGQLINLCIFIQCNSITQLPEKIICLHGSYIGHLHPINLGLFL